MEFPLTSWVIISHIKTCDKGSPALHSGGPLSFGILAAGGESFAPFVVVLGEAHVFTSLQVAASAMPRMAGFRKVVKAHNTQSGKTAAVPQYDMIFIVYLDDGNTGVNLYDG